MSEALSSVRKDVSQSKENKSILSFVCAVQFCLCSKNRAAVSGLISVTEIRSTGQ